MDGDLVDSDDEVGVVGGSEASCFDVPRQQRLQGRPWEGAVEVRYVHNNEDDCRLEGWQRVLQKFVSKVHCSSHRVIHDERYALGTSTSECFP